MASSAESTRAPSSPAEHQTHPGTESKATSTDDYYRFGDLENQALQEELRNVEVARQRAFLGWDRTTREKDCLALSLHRSEATCKEQADEVESLKKQLRVMEHDCEALRRWISSSLPDGNHHVDEFDSSLCHCLQGPGDEKRIPGGHLVC